MACNRISWRQSSIRLPWIISICPHGRIRTGVRPRVFATSSSSSSTIRNRHEPGSKSQVFVSSHYRVQPGEIESYLTAKRIEYRINGICAVAKECPFCPPHKDDPSNLWKLYIWRDNGHCFCHRCGANYTYFEWKRRLADGGHTIISAHGHDLHSHTTDHRHLPELDQHRAYESRSRLAADTEAIDYLTQKRRLRLDIAQKYGVGVAQKTFNGQSEKCLTFPWARLEEDLGFGPIYVDRLKFRSLTQKSHQRLEPKGGTWGLFGWHTIPASADVIVITEGEFDAMAVHQETGYYAVSLPNGANSFPIDILPCLERFKTIYLWMDDDVCGREGAAKFARKLGLNRVLIVRSRAGLDTGPKDANEALIQGLSLSEILKSATQQTHDMIVSVRDLRHDVYEELENGTKYQGVPYKSLPTLQNLLKGHRKGELTVITGPTGLGKTTVLVQLSLDLCLQGTTTLWGSFEIQNKRLIKTMLSQYEGRCLADVDRPAFETIYNRFETLPLFFLKFFSTTDLDEVLEALEFAVYVHDVDHILLDNLQFMLGSGARGINKFDQQDEAISRLRQFATVNNVHISLVIHPRKEAPGQQLSVLSVFGSGKATQESDNVVLLQPSEVSNEIRFLAIGKNRYDGEVGRIAYRFDRGSRRIIELDNFERNQLRLMLQSVKQNQQPAQFVPSTTPIKPLYEIVNAATASTSSSPSPSSPPISPQPTSVLPLESSTFPTRSPSHTSASESYAREVNPRLHTCFDKDDVEDDDLREDDPLLE